MKVDRGLPWHIVLSLLVWVGVTSCAEEKIEWGESGERLSFKISIAEYWNTPSAEKKDAVSTRSYTTPIQSSSYTDSLYLHATITEGIENQAEVADSLLSRAAPITTETFTSFGAFAAAYSGEWDNLSPKPAPNYFYNQEVTKSKQWTIDHYWPGSAYHVRFFAYAPYNCEAATLSAPDHAGAPIIDYTVPADVSEQQDLLVASTNDLKGDNRSNVSLKFAHALTAIRFVVGDYMAAGTIHSITLKGVYSRATIAIGDAAWSGYGTKADFTQQLDLSTDGTPDASITTEAQTFMMLPQTLPDDAEIEVVYTDASSNQHTLTTSIAGKVWPIGKTVTYRLSTTSINWQYTFDVAPLDTLYSYSDEWKTAYSIASYRTNSQGDTIAIPWSVAEYSIDEGKTWATTKPNFLASLTTSGNSINNIECRARFLEQKTFTRIAPHNDYLQERATLSGIYNLSHKSGATGIVENTANCYIINNPGTYTLPLVYGNAIKNGIDNPSAYTAAQTGEDRLNIFLNHDSVAITDPYIYNNVDATGNTIVPDNAILVWQDEEGLITNNSVTLTADKKWIQFTVPAGSTFMQGNAIVAVRDANNTILWSWHIWVTDYIPLLEPTTDHYNHIDTQRDKVLTNLDGEQYIVMPVNLGWCDGETRIYEKRSVTIRFKQTDGLKESATITLVQQGEFFRRGNNSYYQWGRKDPMSSVVETTSNGSTEEKSCYSNSGYTYTGVDAPVDLHQTIQNPHILYIGANATGRYDWCTINYNNLWNTNYLNNTTTIKSIYDPSPVGYKVPPSKVFTGFSYQTIHYTNSTVFSGVVNSPFSSQDYSNNKGWIFYCNKMIAIGEYDTSGGSIYIPCTDKRYFSNITRMRTAYLTTATSGGIGYNNHMELGSTNFITCGAHFRSMAEPVRAIRED